MLRRIPPLRSGDALVDLGCWPGSWLQILAEKVGPRGRIVGVDLEAVEPLGDPVVVLQLDFTESDAPGKIASLLGRPAAAVLCDAAPSLSGVPDVDRAALEEIHEAALRVCDACLREDGSLILKGFPGPQSERIRALLRKRFAHLAELRPEGKRATSKEFYWIATAAPQASRSARSTRRGRRS